VIVLSAAGIYALMSFTVARRRREIGIRAALGADRRQLLLGIFSRALGQLAAGAFAGVLGAIGLEQLMEGDMLQGQGTIIVPLVAMLMVAVGIVSVLGPARQGLRIEPTEALREE
jgi:ABC-type antimicrobial peptide transport system permease subunit